MCLKRGCRRLPCTDIPYCDAPIHRTGGKYMRFRRTPLQIQIQNLVSIFFVWRKCDNLELQYSIPEDLQRLQNVQQMELYQHSMTCQMKAPTNEYNFYSRLTKMTISISIKWPPAGIEFTSFSDNKVNAYQTEAFQEQADSSPKHNLHPYACR